MRTHYRNGDEITLQRSGCDGCSMFSINGDGVHELGCPHEWKDKQRSCRLCGFDFYPAERHQALCQDCIDETEEY